MAEFFTGSPLNRWSFKRHSPEWLLSNEALNDSQILLLNSKNQRHLVSTKNSAPCWLSLSDLPPVVANQLKIPENGNWVFLGRNDTTLKLHWALDVASLGQDTKWLTGTVFASFEYRLFTMTN
jgi:hypothetical protein